MECIYSTSVVQAAIDEAPNAYKDSKEIEPTAIIIDRVKPIMNIKAID
jgi:hypothetical protein